MRVALLVCDHVKDELVEEHGDYPMMFGRLLPKLSLDPWFVCDGQFPDINDYDAFICTGSKYSVYEEIDWIVGLADFVRAIHIAQKKFVGICFGHQMIAHALGGQVKKSARGYLIGVHQFEMKDQPSWAIDQATSFNVLMLCQDQVHDLPPDTKVWASSPSCEVGMFTIGPHFLGIQGHPEYTKDFNRSVFENRSERIGEKIVLEAVKSFNHQPDSLALSHLISAFLSESNKKPRSLNRGLM
ncbi:MAG: type 1 glutamine amidotransferase [Cyclobacteriaceae bacterium]